MEEVQCLPCLHSLPLCDKAACQQKALQRGVTCPQCREVFPVPSGGFAPHPFAGRKAASKQCEGKEVFCHEDHDEPQKAVSYCPQCPGAICEDCVQVHRSLKALKSHTTVPLGKAVSEGSVTRRAAFVCEKHAEKQRLYCLECEALICPLCHSVGGHKSHSVLFVDGEIGGKNMSTLKSCIASAERSISKATCALAQVERSIDVLHQQSQNAKVEIAEVIDHLIAVLKARQAVLVGEVEQLEERAGRELQRQKEKLNQQLTKLKQFKLLTEDLLQHGTSEEQISLKNNVVQRIAAITTTPLPAPLPSCGVHFDSPAIKERLEEELSQLGALKCGAIPQNCSMESLPAPVNGGVLLVRNMPFTFVVITRDKDSKPCWGADRVSATLSPSTCGVPVVGRVEDRGTEGYQVQFDSLPAAHCQLSVTVNGGHTRGPPLVVRAHTVEEIGKNVKDCRDQSVQMAFRALTVGRNGCLLATDKNKEVCVFDRTGCIVKHIQVRETSTCIDGIAEMQDGNIVVSDYGNNCIKVYTPNGQFVQQFDVRGGPSGLAVNGRGQVFVADYKGHRVSVFNQNGRYQYSFGSEGDGPGQFKNPDQICIAPDGLVYVTDGNNRVQVLEQDGKFVRQFGKDVLKCPTGIAVTKDGHVVVASWTANKLSFFKLQGRCFHEVTDIGLKHPFGVAVDACGWVYVSDYDNHRILKL